jgi:hypothetical protein
MPADPKKRQKKLERKASRRKEKQHQLARARHAGLSERMTDASRYPVLNSWVTTDLWTEGLGYVCVSRELPNGMVGFALFLVDRYCLGVKNAMGNVVGRFEYDSQIERKMRSDFTLEALSPAAARRLVEGAVAYARDLGLHPHSDYHKTKPIFGDIDPAETKEEFEYGKDGKPLFVAGPYDSPQRCRRILQTLIASCGVDGFHYLIPSADEDAIPEMLQGSELGRLDAAEDEDE